jgi:hypothetical protein
LKIINVAAIRHILDLSAHQAEAAVDRHANDPEELFIAFRVFLFTFQVRSTPKTSLVIDRLSISATRLEQKECAAVVCISFVFGSLHRFRNTPHDRVLPSQAVTKHVLREQQAYVQVVLAC